MIDDELRLSELGRARRERILERALVEARLRRRRRHMSRSAIVMAAVTTLTIWVTHQADQHDPQPLIVQGPSPTEPPDALTMSFIQTDPGIMERLSIKPAPPTWTRITDDELLQTMANAGHPAGIMYHQGGAMLMTHQQDLLSQ